MNKEEIEELKEFTIDLNDIDEIALGLEICSKKSNMVIQEFIDTIVQLQKENQELKKQIEEINKFKFSYRKDETKIPPIIRKQKDVETIKNLENQQKEFINYMNKTIDELECDDVGDEELKGYLIQEIDIFKEILSKYKEIIEK